MSAPGASVTVGRFLVYDEGCLECGEPSGVVGFYRDPDEATLAKEAAEDRQTANWRGQHWIHVIDLADPEISEHAAGDR